jgi:hypothetical protein
MEEGARDGKNHILSSVLMQMILIIMTLIESRGMALAVWRS